MELENILKLIEAVSASSLTSFTLDDGETKLTLESKPEDGKTVEYIQNMPAMPMMSAMPVMGQMAPMQNMQQPVMFDNQQAATVNNNSTAPAQGTEAVMASGNVVKSPLVGVFYGAPSPDAEDFVKVGTQVTKGQTLGIIEAMKLMNEIECEFDGVIKEVLIKNNEVVEYGQPLFVIG